MIGHLFKEPTMSPSPASPQPTSLQRIRKTSRVLGYFCLLLTWGLPLAAVLIWLLDDQSNLAARVGNGIAITLEQPLATWQRLGGAGVALAQFGCLSVGLWHVRRCLLDFAQGVFFHLRVVVHLRRFAAWVCASSVVSLLSQPVLSVLLTINNGVGHRQLSVGVSGHELFALFIAGTLWLIASVMTHASALADENAQFI